MVELLNSYQIREFANRLLFGRSLEDKLCGPESMHSVSNSDTKSLASFITPTMPGRPPELSFGLTPKKRSTHTFPTKSTFDQDVARGRVLHFFANHELLAIEIMALAILKFENAPQSFIHGIVQTILEEQSHMHLYIGRMKELGVHFGDIPLNGFFWNSLKDMSSPMEYAAAMSLTFEQANIDFCRYFESEFRQVGDQVSAEILKTIRIDEIGHIKHGAVWMQRWLKPSENLWNEYLTLLRFPMTPMRAKGPIFDRDGRKLAGIPEDFIDKLEAFSSSKGRPPVVYFFNPNCEEEIRNRGHYNPPRQILEMTEDMSLAMGLLAHNDDVLLTNANPTVDWLRNLRSSGFDFPEIVADNATGYKLLEMRKISKIKPWGWSRESRIRGKSITRTSQNLIDRLESKALSRENIHSKTYAARQRTTNDLLGFVLEDLSSIIKCIQDLHEQNKTAVLKSPFGSSGRNIIFSPPNTELTENQINWIKSQLKEFQEILIEPWVERLADLSLQFSVTSDKEIKFLGITRFIVNAKGQYKGHVLGKILEGLPSTIPPLWHSSENGWLMQFKSTAKRVGDSLANCGYSGPVGIDGFIYRENKEFKFQSLSEINPRYTMGRIAIELSKHLLKGSRGLWLHLTLKELNQAGYKSFIDFGNEVNSQLGLKIKEHNSQNKQLQRGVLFTNDPATAKQVLTILVLGENPEDLTEILKTLRLGSAPY